MIMMRKNWKSAAMAGAMAGLMAGLLASVSPVAAATPKDTLVLAWAIDDIITLDPAESFEISAGEIMGNTYDRLVRFDINDPSKLYGDIADSWTVSDDGKLYTFKLKPNLKFASGNPLTADDVVYSLQRAVKLDKTPAFILTQLGWSKDNVDSKVKKVDDLTVTLETDKPYAPSFVLNCLTANVAAIIDKKLVEANAKDGDLGYGWLKTHYAGSGPLKIRDWRANEILAMERNDNYYGEKSKLPRVIYRHVKESATQRLLLEKGDVDIARNLEPGDLDAVAKNADVSVTNTPKGTIYYFSLNQKNPTLAKPEVREAMKYLVDYDAIGKTFIKGIGEIHQTFLPKGLLGASDEKPYKLDVAKAKELLAKAGLKDGFTITMDVRNTQPVTGIAEAVQRSFAQAGIKMEIIPGDGKQTLTKYRARNHDLYIGQWGADYWDPHTNADTFARNPDNSDNASSKTLAWRNDWDIPELTKKADAAVLERDTEKRAQLYKDMQKDVLATSPYVIIFQMIETAGVRKDVKDFKLGPTSDTTYTFKASKS
ncbi:MULTISPECIES: ABC transporter substrate-binding protein [unclassified Chelatococcus]|uniref:ABC transporter substrate-binding protein n=1 Tax=unclassified Chelatococcus TaxID=2638111 RepID=UPI001BD1040E|nr:MULTISPECIES: ABC transporter substrate-binding protein [unclassified Chelatococcus]MBS7696898.1 ABC transporter substrate-binding protein [Chelatococcus sp. YT9]MBX3555888.1 ABC transporter substrate-binding protein [Chelatococcus sp.]